MNLQRGTLIAYLTCAIIWGTTWFAIRASIGPDGYPTILAAALRFTLAALVLAPLAIFARPWPRRGEWSWLVLAGALDALGYALIYLGERDVTGGLAAILFGTQPVILSMILIATGMEVVRPVDVISAVVALLGVGIIFADQLDVSTGQAAGVGLILASVVVSALYAMVIKRKGQRINPLVSTAIFVAVTAAFLWCGVAIHGDASIPWPLPMRATVALVYLAVAGTAIAFVAYFWLLARVSLVASNLLAFLLPVIALAIDAAFETDVRIGPRAALGIAVTLAAVVLSRLMASAPTAPADAGRGEPSGSGRGRDRHGAAEAEVVERLVSGQVSTAPAAPRVLP